MSGQYRKVQLIDDQGSAVEIEETHYGAKVEFQWYRGMHAMKFVRPDSAGPLRAAVEDAFRRAALTDMAPHTAVHRRDDSPIAGKLLVMLSPGYVLIGLVEIGEIRRPMARFEANGKSPRTYAALVELVRAIEADNASFPAWNELGGRQ